MRLDVYVNYRGTCEQAFRFYEQHLAGKITGIVLHREQPNPNFPPETGEVSAPGSGFGSALAARRDQHDDAADDGGRAKDRR